MGMIDSRKGMFYLFVSVVLVMVLSATFFLSGSYDLRDRQEPVTARIRTINNFVEDLDNDIQKATFIAAYRALIALEEEIALTGEYLQDAESLFQEAFYNGTVNGANRTVLNASSISDYLERVRLIADDIGVDLDITVKSVILYHDNPWHVSVNLTYENNVSDQKGTASWQYEVEKVTEVTILDLRDPVYSVGTLGKVPSIVKISNYTYLVNDTNDANDTTNLMAFTNGSWYVANAHAPSYIMRLEGDFSNSTQGISSLVNIPDLQEQGMGIDNTRSIADYIYFNSNLTNASPVCFAIINTPSWFKVDEDNLDTYEIDPKLGPEGEGYECPA